MQGLLWSFPVKLSPTSVACLETMGVMALGYENRERRLARREFSTPWYYRTKIRLANVRKLSSPVPLTTTTDYAVQGPHSRRNSINSHHVSTIPRPLRAQASFPHQAAHAVRQLVHQCRRLQKARIEVRISDSATSSPPPRRMPRRADDGAWNADRVIAEPMI